MQYMLLCSFDESRWNAIPESQRDAIMQDYGSFIETHIENGSYLGGGKLDGSNAATTLRQKNGKVVITDGPFAETKEQLGGYHIVECANETEALEIARRIPTLPAGGTIEIRPLLHATV